MSGNLGTNLASLRVDHYAKSVNLLAGGAVGRASPAMGGPRTFEPACTVTDWRRIGQPQFPMAPQIVQEGGIFQGASTPAGPANALGDLWDVKSFSLPSSFLSTLATGSNTLQVTAPYVNDCLSLVAVAANMPASAPPVVQAPIAPVQKQALSPIGQAPAAVSAFGGGGLIRRK